MSRSSFQKDWFCKFQIISSRFSGFNQYFKINHGMTNDSLSSVSSFHFLYHCILLSIIWKRNWTELNYAVIQSFIFLLKLCVNREVKFNIFSIKFIVIHFNSYSHLSTFHWIKGRGGRGSHENSTNYIPLNLVVTFTE